MSSDKHTLEHVLHGSQHRFQLPPGARQVILVRHGSAGGDIVPLVRVGDITIADPPLTPAGHEQAQLLCERLRHEPVTHLFVTPLQRTHQTAAPLAAATGLRPIVIDELHEVHMGDWETTFQERVAARDPLIQRMLEQETYEVIPNAERAADVAARVRVGIAKIIEHLEPGHAAVAVCHGGIVGDICRQATDSRPFAFFGPENASISRLVVHADGRWQLRSFNDVAHLNPLTWTSEQHA